MSKKEVIRNNFPKMEEVLTHLNNNIRSECKDCYYGVAKKEDGYYLTIDEFEGNKRVTKKEIQVWSLMDHDFLQFDITRYEDFDKPNHGTIRELQALYNYRNKFDFMLVFGYPNWVLDVQDIIAQSGDHTLKDYEILARAKSSIAMSYIRPGMNGEHYSFCPDCEDFGFSMYPEHQVEGFYTNAMEAMGYWEKIRSLDPQYKTLIVGKIDNKMGNEYMHFYNVCRSIKEYKKANDFLKKAWYPLSWETYAKRTLDACSKNAFLFTYGDNDTFPFWYVQEKLNYRTDVVVLNLSLLQTEWYFLQMKKEHQWNSTINGSNIHRLWGVPFYAKDSVPSQPFGHWLKETLDELAKDYSEPKYKIMSKGFSLSHKDKNFNVNLRNNMYLSVDLILLDLINSNDRDVFLTSPVQLYEYGLNQNYWSRGNCYQLNVSEQPNQIDEQSIELLDRLIDDFSLSYIQSMHMMASAEISKVCYGINLIGYEQAQAKSDLVEKINTVLPIRDLVKCEQISVIETINALYETNTPTRAFELRKELFPIAGERISEMTVLNKNLEGEVQYLEELFAIYSGKQVWSKWGQSRKLDAMDTAMLQLIFDKADQLRKSPIVHQQAWLEKKLVRLKRGVLDLDID